jgi:muconolactone delta-isomerase
MKILAFEHKLPDATADQFQQYANDEISKVSEYKQTGIIHELYFRADKDEAVLILECSSIDKAHKILAALPFARANLITFELLPLRAYSGFERQFVKT